MQTFLEKSVQSNQLLQSQSIQDNRLDPGNTLLLDLIHHSSSEMPSQDADRSLNALTGTVIKELIPVKRKDFLFPLFGKVNTFWTLIVLSSIVYEAFSVPFKISQDIEITWPIVITDVSVDVIFMLNIILTFFVPIYDKRGKIVLNKQYIAKMYLKSWFFFDLIACIPFSLLWKLKELDPRINEFDQLITNIIPSFYKYVFIVKVIRTRKLNALLNNILQRSHIQVEIQTILRDFFYLVLIVHSIGCLWTLTSKITLFTDTNWIRAQQIYTDSAFYIYLTSVYFVTTTSATVGYGDIIPTNQYEVFITCGILIFGAAYFSYILSDLSTQFNELKRISNTQIERENQIKQLEKDFNINPATIRKINFYFTYHDNKLDLSESLDISFLAKVLPSNLRTQITVFLYKEAIETIAFLRGRTQNFYENYLERLKPQRFSERTNILKQGSKPNEVCFIMSGTVLNVNTGRIFTEGAMFGETDIYYKRERVDTYQAETECYILTYDRATFQNLINEYPDIKEYIEYIATERDKIRRNQDTIKQLVTQDEVRKLITKYLSQIHDLDEKLEYKLQQQKSTQMKNDVQQQIKNKLYILTAIMKSKTNSSNLDELLLDDIQKSPEKRFQKLQDMRSESKRSYLIDDSSSLMSEIEELTEKSEAEEIDTLELTYAHLIQQHNQRVRKQSVRLYISPQERLNLSEKKKSPRRTSMRRFEMSNLQIFKNHNIYNSSGPSLLSVPYSSNQLSVRSSDIQQNSPQMKILNYRKKIQVFMPVLKEALDILKKHEKNFSSKLKKDDDLPESVKQTIEKGLTGIKNYIQILEQVTQQIKRNKKLTNLVVGFDESMITLVQQIGSVERKMNLIETKFTDKFEIQEKIKKVRGRYVNEIKPISIKQKLQEIRDHQLAFQIQSEYSRKQGAVPSLNTEERNLELLLESNSDMLERISPRFQKDKSIHY